MKNIYFFGSCRIHEPLLKIKNINVSERKGLANIYNTKQLIQNLNYNNNMNDIEIDIANNFFSFNNYKKTI